MWSGPRNISTALMRSWGNRSDCAATDEPLYAHYLNVSPISVRHAHPGWCDVMHSQSTDWRVVADQLTGPVPGGKPIWYQKHMSHHLTPEIDRAWVLGLTNCFLIREPEEMITSFIKVIPEPRPEDLGLPQQVELFEWIREQTGQTPPVIDSKDVLTNPRGVLSRICERIGVPFDEAMLAWPPGPRPEDGVWAPHWYSSVYESMSFAQYKPKNETVPDHLTGVLETCRGLYGILAEHRIKA
ncbi:MAG: HAD family hydrolase [Phycisphaera sp.]|nr:HAD family hydrolase [Phycisphaera sp.]